MQSSLVSRNVTLSNGRTSIRLEPEFWNALTDICARERVSLAKWIDTVAADTDGGRTSAVRVSVLSYMSGTEFPNRSDGPRQWVAELAGKTAAVTTGAVAPSALATIG